MRREQSGVSEARRLAELAVHACDPESRKATDMLVTELAENIVKYGAIESGVFAGTISIALTGSVICVRAKNQVSRSEDAKAVEATIALISAAPDVTTVYRARLAALFANPKLPRAQLGLLRAAFEGGFRLSCSYENRTLEIEAERTFDPA